MTPPDYAPEPPATYEDEFPWHEMDHDPTGQLFFKGLVAAVCITIVAVVVIGGVIALF